MSHLVGLGLGWFLFVALVLKCVDVIYTADAMVFAIGDIGFG